MVTEEEWDNNMELLGRTIDNWVYRMDLTDKERNFLQMIMGDLLDKLDEAKWDKLQQHLKNAKNEDDE